MKHPRRANCPNHSCMRLLRHISHIGASTFEFENVQTEHIHGTNTFFVFRLESRTRENTSTSVFCDVVLFIFLLLELCEEFSALCRICLFLFRAMFFLDPCFKNT